MYNQPYMADYKVNNKTTIGLHTRNENPDGYFLLMAQACARVLNDGTGTSVFFPVVHSLNVQSRCLEPPMSKHQR